MTRSTKRLTSLAAAAIVMAGIPVSAQQAPRPVFRSGAAVVEITVIVRDKSGAFVRGLTAEDFDVREAGQRQRIETLYFVEGPPRTSANPAPKTAPPEGTTTLAAATSPRVFVFLFDLDHLSPGGLTRAREAVEKFGAGRLLATDLSGMAALGGEQRGRISNDHRAVVESVRRLKPRSDRLSRERELREWPRVSSPLEAADIARDVKDVVDKARDRACLDKYERIDPCLGDSFPALANRTEIEQELRRKTRAYVTESRVAAERSVGAVSEMSQLLAGLAGRKTIIWFTESTWSEEVAERARQAAFMASQSGVAVYTVDPRGLGRQAERSMDQSPAEVGVAFLHDLDDVANLMAAGSGGLPIRNENNLARALEQVEEDTSTYYVLGYAVAGNDDRSQYRELSVRLRREGVSARVRHGFMSPQRATPASGHLVASALTVAPGTRWALAMPSTKTAAAAEPSAVAAEATASNVARLRGLSGKEDTARLASSGWRAYERGDLEAALPLFEKAAAMKDVRPWTLYAMGFTYLGLGRPRDAIAAWERVRAAAPDFPQVYLDLAAHYAQASDLTEALSVLREAARRWPSNEEVHNGIGVLMVRRNGLDEAIEAFSKATKAAPKDALSWLNLGRAYELRYDRARRYDEQRLRWVGPEGDRVNAAQSYERCVQLGGPYAPQAADALARMNWSQ